MPCSSAVVVKQYETLETFAVNPVGSPVGVAPGKKLKVVSTIATVGPAARKLHQRIAKQTIKAMVYLYHCGLVLLDIAGAKFLAVVGSSPIQGIVGVSGGRRHQDDLVGFMMAKADVSKGPVPRLFQRRVLTILGVQFWRNVVFRHLARCWETRLVKVGSRAVGSRSLRRDPCEG